MFSFFRNSGVGAKIGLGYAIVALILVAAVTTTIWQVGRTATVTNRVIDLRAPTAQASLGMLNGINHSLAALRGWMILGKDKFKTERAKAWSDEIEPAMATMTKFAVNWTNPKNIERLKTIETNLANFKKYQKEIEDISQTVENMPAMKILFEEAAPKAKILAQQITRMIDLEAEYDADSMLEASRTASGAIELAKVVAEQVANDRAYYAKNVIGKLKKEIRDFQAGRNYHDIKGSIPAPATFVRETSEALDKDAGYRYDLLSKFNINKDKGLRNSFEEQAWERLSGDPKTPYAEFVSMGSGVVEYRYARADVASAETCVSCHNGHEDSPKKDFKLGELMGILVVSAPVTQDPKVGEVLLSFGRDNGTEFNIAELPRHLSEQVGKRKALFSMMADTRGTLGLGLGAVRAYLLAGDEKFKQQFDTLWAKNTRRFGDLSDNVGLLTPDQRVAYDLFAKARKQFDPLPPKMFAIRGGNEWNVANRWLGTKAAPTAFAIKTELDAMIASQQGLMQTDMVESKRLTAFLKQVEWGLLAGGLVLCTVLGLVITRSITKPINRIVSGLNDGANQVNDAAGQVSSTSQQLAEGATEQASSLEETSSALEEMAAMTKTNASNAKQANELSGQARTAAESGDKTMGRLNEAMTAINESSGKISKIIKVIEEIAFQTNLLALNAAVEAARAGEHGKGFAVVADEVRNLAQRAAQAAGETTDLIEDSVNRAREGTEVACEVADSLGKIVGDVSKVSDLINGITKASDEQAQGVEQVNTAVSQMDKVTQSNAAGAEESASASEELASQAMAVKGMVDELATIIRGGGRGTGANSVVPAAATHGPARGDETRSRRHGRAASRELVGAAASDARGEPRTSQPAAQDDFLPLDKEDLKDF